MALTVVIRTWQAAIAAQLAAAGVGVAIGPRFAGVVVPMDPPLGRDRLCLVANPADARPVAVLSGGVRVA